MSILFDASGDYLSILSGVPPEDPFTFMGWFYWPSAPSGTGVYFFSLAASGGAAFDALRMTSGMQLQAATQTGNTGGSTLVTGRWYHIARVRSGSSHLVYLNGVLDLTRTHANSFTEASMSLGSDTLAVANMRAANLMAFTAALNEVQIRAQMGAYLPRYTGNMYGWWPCNPGATERARDYSGNRRHFTENGTLTDAGPPPIAWDRAVIILAPPAVSGQTISPSGITSEEVFGTPTITVGAVTITPTGIASAETFGTPTVIPGVVTISPTGISSTEAFGTPTVQPGEVTITPSGIASAEVFGTPTLQPGTVTVSPSGIASAEAFGTPTIQADVQTLLPTGIASDETFGLPTITVGEVIVQPTAIASAEVFGTPTVQPGVVVITPSSVASAEAFGVPTIIGGSSEMVIVTDAFVASRPNLTMMVERPIDVFVSERPNDVLVSTRPNLTMIADRPNDVYVGENDDHN